MENVYYGSTLASEIREGLKERVDKLIAQEKRIPCLAVILVGNNPASRYIRRAIHRLQIAGPLRYRGFPLRLLR